MTEGLRLLGLARRAGRIMPGVPAVRRSVRTGTARLVVTAADAAPGQLAKVEVAARRNGVPVRSAFGRATLGAAVGCGPTTAVAVTDAGLAERIRTGLAGPARAGRDAFGRNED